MSRPRKWVGPLGWDRAGIVAAIAIALTLGSAPAAQAGFGVARWEAGTCNGEPPVCSYASPPSQFFTQVAGRPPLGITDFELNRETFENGKGEVRPGLPEGGELRDVRVDLPPGLSVNPESVPRCTEQTLEGLDGIAKCTAAGAAIGKVSVAVFGPENNSELVVPASVFNLVPKFGEPAEFGFRVRIALRPEPDPDPLLDATVFLDGSADWSGDYHEGFTIRQLPRLALGGSRLIVAGARLSFDGSAGGGLITVGSDCQGSTTSTLTVDSYEEPSLRRTLRTTPINPELVIPPSGCEAVPFEPSIEVEPGTTQTDSPTASTVDLRVPYAPTAKIGQANLKRATVTLPPGMGLNPAAANGLEACSDAQFGKGIAIGDPISAPEKVQPPPLACPPASRIGSVTIETPVLPAGALRGDLYLGRQLSRDPASGKEFRLFLAAESARFGTYVRLLGEVAADPASGRLTASFDDPAHGGLPQVPFTSFKVGFDPGRGALTSPPTCGPSEIGASLSPWSGRADALVADSFALSRAPGGGPCARSLAERPFAPSFSAGVAQAQANTFSPLRIQLGRADGQQELKGVDVVLPPSLTARLRGVPFCDPARIAAATSAPGSAEASSPSCPETSRVGSTEILAGSGPHPVRIPGRAYLAGPYRGAQLSLAVVTPALAGPFDLGTSVVMLALFLDPETAQIHAVSDPIPSVFGGVRLDVRSISLNLDRPQFSLTGSNCDPQSSSGTLHGGGGDPANPAAFSSVPVSQGFQLDGCKRLRFAPKLSVRLLGETGRSQHPSLRTVLKARAGDSNIRSASLALPHALFVDQASLGKICTRVQFAASACPRKSVYGHAIAYSPLLDKPLSGPVYLRSSTQALPDLVAHLSGQITIDLVGHLDSFRGGIRTSFGAIPDVPVSKFMLSIPGGRNGLLVASQNLCDHLADGIVRIRSQSKLRVATKTALQTPCRKPKRRR